MALPSQTARPIARRSHMYRRSRGRRSPRGAVYAVVAVALFGGLFGAVKAGWITLPGAEEGAGGAPRGAFGAIGLEEPPNRLEGFDNETGAATPPGTGRAATPPVTPPVVAAATPEQPDLAAPREAEERREADPTPTLEMGAALPVASETPAPEAAAAPEPNPVERTFTQSGGPVAPGVALARQGLDLAGEDPVRARAMLSRALESRDLTDRETQLVRDRLMVLNETLVFGPAVLPGDPFVRTYTVESGDSLSVIRRRLGLLTDWRFIQRVNGIDRPERIGLGQQLKVVTGPFHAVVHKDLYRLDLYLGEGSDRVFVRSFPVGLGEHGSTPIGRFEVRPDSKLIDPQWVNPRTGERFASADPANPIGEHWLGLRGLDEQTRGLSAYGIHGTIEPESIGREQSMGCVRMRAEDVAIVWETLVEGASTIEIRP